MAIKIDGIKVAGLGNDPKTPYQIAAENGFAGSEEDFNIALGTIQSLSQEMEELKTSVSESKSQIAAAVTDKGVNTAANANFETIITNIENISTLKAETTDATAAATEILSGEVAYVDGNKVVGTMPNNGAVTPSALAAGGSYTIPAGYHNGTGVVSTKTLAEQTDGTATSTQILKDKTAYVNGAKITGTMIDQAAQAVALTYGSSYVIPEGHHSGNGTVSAQALPTLSSAAKSGQILSGYQAIDQNGNVIKGTAAKAKTSIAIGKKDFYVDIDNLSFDGTNITFKAYTYGNSSCYVSLTLS